MHIGETPPAIHLMSIPTSGPFQSQEEASQAKSLGQQTQALKAQELAAKAQQSQLAYAQQQAQRGLPLQSHGQPPLQQQAGPSQAPIFTQAPPPLQEVASPAPQNAGNSLAEQGDQIEYVGSEHTSAAAPLIMGAVGGAMVAVLAIIYGVLSAMVPYVKLDFLLAIFFTAGVAQAVAVSGKLGKCNSVALGCVVALVLAVFAFWVQWLAYLSYLAKGFVYLSPITTVQTLMALAQDGVWTYRDSVMAPTTLYLMWFVEMIAIVGCSMLFFVQVATGNDVWTEEED